MHRLASPPSRNLVHVASLAALLSASAATAGSAQELTEQRRIEVARRLQESTVLVAVGDGSGSGFVVGEERWIVTNAHVAQAGRYLPILVQFGSGQRIPARLVAFDPNHDLAILAADGQVPVRPLALADSDDVQVGQAVLAFGSPFGLEGTLTQGIVSARRTLPGIGGGGVEGLIQTDAPINPGNSGGPLVNARGEVVGVNTAILSRSGANNGIAFAVPSNYVRELVRRVRAEVARRGAARTDEPRARDTASAPVWLGIEGVDFAGGGYEGVRVQRVTPGSPAARAGIAGASDPPPSFIDQLGVPWTGQIILAVQGQPVRGLNDLQRLLATMRPGDRASVLVTIGPGVISGETVVEFAAPPRSSRIPR